MPVLSHRGWVCYYLGLWNPYEAFTLLTDSECGIIFDYGYSKYFVQLYSAFLMRKERKGGKAGAELAVRHHFPQLWQRQIIKTCKLIIIPYQKILADCM